MPPEFTVHEINTGVSGYKDLRAIDLNGDTNLDMVWFTRSEIGWHKNLSPAPPVITHTGIPWQIWEEY